MSAASLRESAVVDGAEASCRRAMACARASFEAVTTDWRVGSVTTASTVMVAGVRLTRRRCLLCVVFGDEILRRSSDLKADGVVCEMLVLLDGADAVDVPVSALP